MMVACRHNRGDGESQGWGKSKRWRHWRREMKVEYKVQIDERETEGGRERGDGGMG